MLDLELLSFCGLELDPLTKLEVLLELAFFELESLEIGFFELESLEIGFFELELFELFESELSEVFSDS